MNNKAFFNMNFSFSLFIIILSILSLFYINIINKTQSIKNLYNSLDRFIYNENMINNLYNVFFEHINKQYIQEFIYNHDNLSIEVLENNFEEISKKNENNFYINNKTDIKIINDINNFSLKLIYENDIIFEQENINNNFYIIDEEYINKVGTYSLIIYYPNNMNNYSYEVNNYEINYINLVSQKISIPNINRNVFIDYKNSDIFYLN